MLVHTACCHGNNSAGESLDSAEQTRCTRLTLWRSNLSDCDAGTSDGECIERRLSDADAEHPIWAANESVRRHVKSTKRETESTDSKWAIFLGDSSADSCKQNPWHSKNRNAGIAHPIRCTHVVHHHYPQRIKHADHHVERDANKYCASEWSDAQQVDSKTLSRAIFGGSFFDFFVRNQRHHHYKNCCDDQKRRGQTKRANCQSRNDWSKCKTAYLDRDAATQIGSHVFWVTDNDDALDCRDCDAGSDAH